MLSLFTFEYSKQIGQYFLKAIAQVKYGTDVDDIEHWSCHFTCENCSFRDYLQERNGIIAGEMANHYHLSHGHFCCECSVPKKSIVGYSSSAVSGACSIKVLPLHMLTIAPVIACNHCLEEEDRKDCHQLRSPCPLRSFSNSCRSHFSCCSLYWALWPLYGSRKESGRINFGCIWEHITSLFRW